MVIKVSGHANNNSLESKQIQAHHHNKVVWPPSRRDLGGAEGEISALRFLCMLDVELCLHAVRRGPGTRQQWKQAPFQLCNDLFLVTLPGAVMSMDNFTTVQTHFRKPSSLTNTHLAPSVISLSLLLIFSCDLSYASRSQLTGPNTTRVQVSLNTTGIFLNFLPHLTAKLLIY